MNKLTKYILLVVVCVIIPSALVWNFLPSMLGDYPKVYSIVHRVTAIYITVVVTWLLISFANTFRSLGEHHNVPHQQYLNSFISVLKIVLIFIAVIVVIAIIVNKDPSTLIAGLGAASAILMLAFQDTIKGLVAGIRLTSNNMLSIGDRITLPSAGIDGIVEEIMLTTVKVRNFDNTIMKVGRKAVRKVFFDFRSIVAGEDGVVNLTRYREHMEEWLKKHHMVLKDNMILVHQLDATPTGLPLEFVFWLNTQDVLPFEHAISEIMEYAYAEANTYGLRIYQQFPEQ